jgi:hypothetical protein
LCRLRTGRIHRKRACDVNENVMPESLTIWIAMDRFRLRVYPCGMSGGDGPAGAQARPFRFIRPLLKGAGR